MLSTWNFQRLLQYNRPVTLCKIEFSAQAPVFEIQELLSRVLSASVCVLRCVKLHCIVPYMMRAQTARQKNNGTHCLF